jgi:lipoyl(octanoyl) transferase
MTIKWSFLGQTTYRRSLTLQEELREQVAAGPGADFLLLLNHPPVVTRGVSDQTGDSGLIEPRATLEAEGIPIFDVDRGGKTTFHGPDQLVGYFIFDLKRRQKKLKTFVADVAQAMIMVLDTYGIDATYDENDPGIMVGDRKIGFLGFSVKRNITAHGFSLNVGRDLRGFDFIVPCGKVGRRITSMEDEVGRHFSMYDVYWRLITTVGELFEDDLDEIFVDTLIKI